MQYQPIGYRCKGFYRMAKYGRRWEVFKMYGIEQKLKIIRHAERYGTASCCDAFDVKAGR
ncbi:MAG: hypothetical protein R1F54_08425 [Candidatus Zeuxoniibacter abyssi]|nr:MAG: hypothetical protein R1F54_08425 [Candidatus Persebacteraceae bacterium AB1(2)]